MAGTGSQSIFSAARWQVDLFPDNVQYDTATLVAPPVGAAALLPHRCSADFCRDIHICPESPTSCVLVELLAVLAVLNATPLSTELLLASLLNLTHCMPHRPHSLLLSAVVGEVAEPHSLSGIVGVPRHSTSADPCPYTSRSTHRAQHTAHSTHATDAELAEWQAELRAHCRRMVTRGSVQMMVAQVHQHTLQSIVRMISRWLVRSALRCAPQLGALCVGVQWIADLALLSLSVWSVLCGNHSTALVASVAIVSYWVFRACFRITCVSVSKLSAAVSAGSVASLPECVANSLTLLLCCTTGAAAFFLCCTAGIAVTLPLGAAGGIALMLCCAATALVQDVLSYCTYCCTTANFLRLSRRVVRHTAPSRLTRAQCLVLLMLLTLPVASADSGFGDVGGIAPFLLPAGVVGQMVWRALEGNLGSDRTIDLKDMIQEVRESSDMPVNASFIGDDITVKSDCVGSRMVSFNAHRSLMQIQSVDPTAANLSSGVNYAHEMSKVLVMRSVDLAVVHEPGITEWATDEATLLSRMDGDWRFRYVQRPSSKRDTNNNNQNSGGVLIIMTAQMESAIVINKLDNNNESVTVPLGGAPESDRLVVLEFLNPLSSTPTKERTYNERLMVAAVYGYNTSSDRGNPWGSNKVPQATLMGALTKCTHEFRDNYPKASVVM